MSNLRAAVLFESLTKVDDPRREHQRFHSLKDILVISICAVICGVKQEWFAEFLELENGIPSHDTFRRVFMLLDNSQLKEVFIDWISSAVELSKGALVNIDGKQMRGSREASKGRQALNVVSAWASEVSVVLGQVVCQEKSNEITAIPALLKILDLEGCIVTIDAMGCQKEIVKEIVGRGADYVISLKGNHGTLHQEIRDYLDWAERTGFKDIKYEYNETLLRHRRD